jgi:hypothetical protein
MGLCKESKAGRIGAKMEWRKKRVKGRGKRGEEWGKLLVWSRERKRLTCRSKIKDRRQERRGRIERAVEERLEASMKGGKLYNLKTKQKTFRHADANNELSIEQNME